MGDYAGDVALRNACLIHGRHGQSFKMMHCPAKLDAMPAKSCALYESNVRRPRDIVDEILETLLGFTVTQEE
jgi:hypothetical protein